MRNLYSGKPGARQMIILALMAGGFSTVDQVNNNLVPLTVRQFTDNALLIAAVLATNRLFGFVVQPYVCWKSDYVRTRWGCRRPFLLAGLPLTALSMLAVGALPVFITGDARHSMWALLIVVVVNVAMQAVIDVSWGALEPLYADTFRQEQLGRAGSVRQIAAQLVNLAMVGYVIGWADINEFYPYLFSAACVGASFLLMLFVVREQPAGAPPPAKPYHPLTHLRLLANPDYARLAFVCASNLVLPATFSLFTSLYVTDTLGLTKTELGHAQMLGPFLTLGLALPTGWLVDRFGPKWIMATGFGFHVFGFCGMAFLVRDFWSLFTFMTVVGVAQVLTLLPMAAMVFQYASSTERGQLFGIVQFTRAFSAFVVTLVLGSAVQLAVSHDPTPVRLQDLKETRALIVQLDQPESPAELAIAGQLSPATRDLIREHAAADAEASPELREALVTEFNLLCAGPVWLDQPSAVVLSAQSRKLLDRATSLAADDRFVFNRSLLHDALEGKLSAKLNYRVTYYFGIVLALIATVVTVRSHRGRFAQTL